MSQMKTFRHFENVAAGGTDDKSTPNVPSNKTYLIKCVDFTCPTSKDCGVIIYYGGTALSDIRMAAQSDKWAQFGESGIVIEGDGTKNITVRLDNNDSSTRFLGCVIYYEELG